MILTTTEKIDCGKTSTTLFRKLLRHLLVEHLSIAASIK